MQDHIHNDFSVLGKYSRESTWNVSRLGNPSPLQKKKTKKKRKRSKSSTCSSWYTYIILYIYIQTNSRSQQWKGPTSVNAMLWLVSFGEQVRRAPHATTGEPWPLPQYYTKKDKNILVVDPNFQFLISSNISCDIIDQVSGFLVFTCSCHLSEFMVVCLDHPMTAWSA